MSVILALGIEPLSELSRHQSSNKKDSYFREASGESPTRRERPCTNQEEFLKDNNESSLTCNNILNLHYSPNEKSRAKGAGLSTIVECD